MAGSSNLHSAHPNLNNSTASWHNSIAESEHKRFFLSVDWNASILGPLDTWSLALRLQTLAVLANTQATCLYWGPERVAIYNEAFVSLTNDAHPKLMGQPFYVGFPEIWDDIRPVFEMSQRTGLATDVNELELFVRRSGYLEETYFNGNFNPVCGDDLEIAGFNNSVFEITKTKLNERRTKMINKIAGSPPQLDMHHLDLHVIECFEENSRDIPLAMIYAADEEKMPGTCLISIRGLLGVSPDHPLATNNTDLDYPGGIVPFLQKARAAFGKSGASCVVTMPVDARFDGVNWQGFGEPSKTICAAALSAGTRLIGFIVLGMNPRRAEDDVSIQFVKDIARQLSATKATALSIEEARKREQQLQEELSQSEKQIRYLANHAGVAMQHLRLDGSTIWANEKYYELTGHTKPSFSGPLPFSKLSFIDIIHPDDQAFAKEKWAELIGGCPQIAVEMRLKTLYTPPTGDPEPRTMLSLAFPYLEEGKVKSIMSCMVDVSSMRWQEQWQARNAQIAQEAKRQQEEFIDVVSHEMRNPLVVWRLICQIALHSNLEADTRDGCELHALFYLLGFTRPKTLSTHYPSLFLD